MMLPPASLAFFPLKNGNLCDLPIMYITGYDSNLCRVFIGCFGLVGVRVT